VRRTEEIAKVKIEMKDWSPEDMGKQNARRLGLRVL